MALESYAVRYRRLCQRIEEEMDEISRCLDGEPKEEYLRVLRKEKDFLENNLRLINTIRFERN